MSKQNELIVPLRAKTEPGYPSAKHRVAEGSYRSCALGKSRFVSQSWAKWSFLPHMQLSNRLLNHFASPLISSTNEMIKIRFSDCIGGAVTNPLFVVSV